MRDINFRGKRTDNGEWVYGVPTKDGRGEMVMVENIFECEEYNCRGANCLYVDENTVGQYTGLKDKNGTKIFEGDIVLVPYIDPIFKCAWNDTSPCERAIVKHCNGMFYVEYIESGDKFTLSAMDGYMKIIGNIYDNKLEDFNNGTC